MVDRAESASTPSVGFREPSRRDRKWKRAFVHAAIILGVGAAIGVVDAQLRPVKLNRTVGTFAIDELPEGLSGGERRPMANSDEPGTNPLTNAATSAASTASETTTSANPAAGAVVGSTPVLAAPDPASPKSAGGFQFTPKDKLPSGQITVIEAKRAFDSGQASFVDARTKANYELGHIPNSVRLELASFAEGEPAKLGLLPREMMVIIYCAGGHCDESERVAERLEGFGYSKIFIIHDGFPGWQAAGHAVEVGPEAFE